MARDESDCAGVDGEHVVESREPRGARGVEPAGRMGTDAQGKQPTSRRCEGHGEPVGNRRYNIVFDHGPIVVRQSARPHSFPIPPREILHVRPDH